MRRGGVNRGLLVCSMLAALAPTARLAAAAAPSTAPAAAPLSNYTVQAGDSCGVIARRLYGDPHRIDLIHTNNNLGPLPHKLRPGMVLRLPASASSGTREPDARLTFVRNQVEAYTPDYHRGKKNEALAQGNRVGTLAASSAEISFVNETRMQLGEHSMVVIFGDDAADAGRHRPAANPQEATLLRGTLRAHLAELSGTTAPGKPIAVTTPGARVELPARDSEVHVDVDPQSTTRLSVLRGRSRLAAAGRKVEVPQGFGSRADKGRPPTPPHPLPGAPVWTTTLPPLILGRDQAPGAVVSYRAGAGPAAAAWHRQLARDASFNDLLEDTRVPGAALSWSLPALPAGEVFLRVSAIDADHFEGLPAPVLTARAALVQLVPSQSAEPAAVRFSGGVVCGLDGAPLTAAGPVVLTPARDHRLRCAVKPDAAPADTSELVIPAADSGAVRAVPEHGQTRWTATHGERDFAFRLTDQAGAPLPIPVADLQLRAAAGVSVAPLIPGETGGYRTHLRWPLTVSDLGLSVQLRGVQLQAIPLRPEPQESEPPPLAAPLPAPSSPPPAAPRLGPRIWLEVGAAGLVLFNQGEYGLGGGIEVGPRVRLPVGAIGLALRLAAEQHLQPEPAPFLLGLGATLTYVLSRPSWRVHPYVGLGAQTLLPRVPLILPGASTPLPGRNAILAGLVGAELRLWKGSLFLFGELGYRGAVYRETIETIPAWNTAFLQLGFRLSTN